MKITCKHTVATLGCRICFKVEGKKYREIWRQSLLWKHRCFPQYYRFTRHKNTILKMLMRFHSYQHANLGKYLLFSYLNNLTHIYNAILCVIITLAVNDIKRINADERAFLIGLQQLREWWKIWHISLFSILLFSFFWKVVYFFVCF